MRAGVELGRSKQRPCPASRHGSAVGSDSLIGSGASSRGRIACRLPVLFGVPTGRVAIRRFYTIQQEVATVCIKSLEHGCRESDEHAVAVAWRATTRQARWIERPPEAVVEAPASSVHRHSVVAVHVPTRPPVDPTRGPSYLASRQALHRRGRESPTPGCIRGRDRLPRRVHRGWCSLPTGVVRARPGGPGGSRRPAETTPGSPVASTG